MTKFCAKCQSQKPLSDFGPRKTKNGMGSASVCRPCDKERAAEYRENNPALVSERKKIKLAKLNPSYAPRRKGATAEKADTESTKAWINAKTAKRRARRRNAAVAWVDNFICNEFYDLARLRTKLTGIAWHVDHIVPLASKKVCGLHWEGNLCVIPARANRSKGNRTWPNM